MRYGSDIGASQAFAFHDSDSSGGYDIRSGIDRATAGVERRDGETPSEDDDSENEFLIGMMTIGQSTTNEYDEEHDRAPTEQ